MAIASFGRAVVGMAAMKQPAASSSSPNPRQGKVRASPNKGNDQSVAALSRLCMTTTMIIIIRLVHRRGSICRTKIESDILLDLPPVTVTPKLLPHHHHLLQLMSMNMVRSLNMSGFAIHITTIDMPLVPLPKAMDITSNTCHTNASAGMSHCMTTDTTSTILSEGPTTPNTAYVHTFLSTMATVTTWNLRFLHSGSLRVRHQGRGREKGREKALLLKMVLESRNQAPSPNQLFGYPQQSSSTSIAQAN